MIVGEWMKAPEYCSYVLRFWQEEDEQGSSWRFMLLNPLSGERQGFASLEKLFAFLEERIERISGAGSTEQGTGEYEIAE